MSEHTPIDQKSTYAHMIRGSAWGVAMRWGTRFIGLISTLILARLLFPADFGIVAMAALTYGVLDMFFELGLGLYLIRTREVLREDWDTAWTIRVLQGLCLAGLLLAVAPLAARYFAEPRVVAVIHWLALAATFRGAENIGIFKFQKELDFASDFRFGIYSRLIMFCITIPAALILQTYWALVIGQVAGAFMRTLLSFHMHPYRPRFTLSRAKALLTFSMHMVLISLSRYTYEKSDAFVAGGIVDSAQFGAYSVAASVSTMFTGEVTNPIGRALFANYAKIIHDPERFAAAYVHSISAIAILCIALGVGLSSVAHSFVLVLLGSKWESATPLVEWLALYSLINSIVHSLGVGMLLVPGGERRAMILSFVRLFMLAPAVAAAGVLWGLQAVAVAATLAALTFAPVMIHGVTHVLPITTAQILGALWRPLSAGAFMAWVVRSLELPNTPVVLSLAADVFAGAVAYVLALVVLWFLAGRPAGPERATLRFLASRVSGRGQR